MGNPADAQLELLFDAPAAPGTATTGESRENGPENAPQGKKHHRGLPDALSAQERTNRAQFQPGVRWWGSRFAIGATAGGIRAPAAPTRKPPRSDGGTLTMPSGLHNLRMNGRHRPEGRRRTAPWAVVLLLFLASIGLTVVVAFTLENRIAAVEARLGSGGE